MIFVTGGAGFIGTNLALDALNKGYKVIIVDDLSRRGAHLNLSMLLPKGIVFEHCDVRNFHKLSISIIIT